MHRPPTLTRREKTILMVFILSGVAVLIIYVALGIVRDGLPVRATTQGLVEIAILVPFENAQIPLQETLLGVVQWAINNLPPDTSLPLVQQVALMAYDTQGTPDGAAKAARRAARKQATVAIIGPLDARQVLAAAETIQGRKLALITPASTAPALPVGNIPGLYRIPAPDNLQGQAIVEFLDDHLMRRNVFLFARANAYVQNILEVFNQAARDRLRVVGTLDLSQVTSTEEITRQVLDSEADVIVYLGGREDFDLLLRVLVAPDVDLPVVASDMVNDPSLPPLANETLEVYYTSPILNMGDLPEDTLVSYQEALGEYSNRPFAFETVQAVWAVFAALEFQEKNQTPREAVWENLGRVRLDGLGGVSTAFWGGQWSPGVIYIYQIDPTQGDWSANPVVATVMVER